MSTEHVVVLTKPHGQLMVDGIGKECQFDKSDKCTLRCAMMVVNAQPDRLLTTTLNCCTPEMTYTDVLGEYFEDAASEIEGG